MVVTASERSKRVSSGYSGAVVLGLQRTRRLAAAGWVGAGILDVVGRCKKSSPNHEFPAQ